MILRRELHTENLGGYGRVFRDRPYVIFALLVGMGLIAPSMLWTLLSVYTKINYGLPENLFGWLPTTNALMCVFRPISGNPSHTAISTTPGHRGRDVNLRSRCGKCGA